MSYKDYQLSSDTTPRAREVLFRMLMKKSPLEKLAMVSQMNATVRTFALSGLRDRYRDDTELQLKVRLAELLYGQINHDTDTLSFPICTGLRSSAPRIVIIRRFRSTLIEIINAPGCTLIETGENIYWRKHSGC